MDNYVIQAQHLCKQFDNKKALNHLNLQIPYGGVHAIVGSNGAGKSTLFKILLGIISPTSGQAQILGTDVQALSPKERGLIGFVNEEHSLPLWLNVKQLSTMHQQDCATWNASIFKQMLGNINVLPKQKVSQLSRGERAGLNLAIALAQSPKLLILDEPTLGLDVVAKQAFLNALQTTEALNHTTVIYCSHQMDEVEKIADNLIIMENGQVVCVSDPQSFRARIHLWVASFDNDAPDNTQVPGLLSSQKIAGEHHFLVMDQDLAFERFLEKCGANLTRNVPLDLNDAVNGFLSKNHVSNRQAIEQ